VTSPLVVSGVGQRLTNQPKNNVVPIIGVRVGTTPNFTVASTGNAAATLPAASGVGAVNQATPASIQAANPGTSYGLVVDQSDYGVTSPTVTEANTPLPTSTSSTNPLSSISSLFSSSSGGISPMVLVIGFLLLLLILK
jgi:hypothetical protein